MATSRFDLAPGRPAPVPGWWQSTAAGVLEGLLTGILAGLGSSIAVVIGVAITLAAIHDPNLTPPGRHPELAGWIAFAVVPIAILVTLARRWLRQPASATSGVPGAHGGADRGSGLRRCAADLMTASLAALGAWPTPGLLRDYAPKRRKK